MAKRRGLTPIAIAALKPRAERYEVPDRGSDGLRLVVQPSGRKGWCLRYRRPESGKTAKLTIGNGATPLAGVAVAVAISGGPTVILMVFVPV